MSVTPINPAQLAEPRGYSHGVLAEGRLLSIAGQIGWDGDGKLVSSDFAQQFGRALSNMVAVLHEAGGVPSDLITLRIYVTNKKLYLAKTAEVGEMYRELLGNHYPAMALVQVADLLEDGALVEIEGLAVLP
jgi:enamine deaminase RidA (YjgF/YER057c/UK114 family)